MSLQTYLTELNASPSTWLGQIVMFSVPEATIVSAKKLNKAMKDAELSDYVPSPPRASNVFRRVSSEQSRKHVPTDTPGVYENYRIEQVVRSNRRIVKDIVVQQVNTNDEELSFEPQVRLQYDNMAETIEYWYIGAGKENQQALNVAALICQNFLDVVDSYNSSILRSMIRGMLDDARATLIQGGKAYFVADKYQKLVAGLQVVSAALPIDVTVIPLPDTERQRDMVRQSFQSETIGAIDDTIREINEIGDSIVTTETFERLANRKADLVDKTKEYTELLGLTMAETDVRLRAFEKKIQKLSKQIKE